VVAPIEVNAAMQRAVMDDFMMIWFVIRDGALTVGGSIYSEIWWRDFFEIFMRLREGDSEV